MKHGTSTAALFVMLLLVVVLGLVLIFSDKSPESEKPSEDKGPSLADKFEEAPDAAEPENKPAPEQEEPTEQPDGEEEETSAPEEKPEEEPEEEKEEPEEEKQPEEEKTQETPQETPPQFVSRSLGSGTLRSDTGTAVNLIANWSAVTTDADTVEFTVSTLVESYALQAGASPGGLRITVYGTPISLNTPELNLTTESLVQTPMGSYTFTINMKDGTTAVVPVKAEWFFAGVYSGVSLPVITCSGDITLTR